MKLTKILFAVLVLMTINAYCQNEPVIIEAENGTLGSDYQTLTDGDVTYITPGTNYIEPATQPNDASKVASFTVIFPDSGTYKLFARIRIGSNNYDDDSFYYANGLGSKNPTVGDDWITCNNMVASGYTILADVVQEGGDAGLEVWKWLALSEYTGDYGESPITFRVEQGELTQTFEIGAREDGFDVDKIAFGRVGIYYTVDNLNKGEAGSTTDPGDVPPTPPLANGLDKFLGCAYGTDTKRDFANYWNQVTPGNAGKWGSVEYARDNMNWTELDEAYQLAMDSGFVYKHHVLVWGAQQPTWIAALDSAAQRTELEEWFAAVAARYPGIDQVEVVNEPLHQPPDDDPEQNDDGGYIKALGGAGTTGWDWIIEAFRMARATFPDTAMLMINEYGIMNSTSNTDKYLEIIRLLQDNDSLIDAIGFQAHGFSHDATNATILRNIDSLASTGLPIYVTELDIDGLTDLQQVHGYMNLFPLFWEHPAIKGITMWGFRPAMWRGEQGAYLIDELGVERPAMLWLRAYLKNEFKPNDSIKISSASGLPSIFIRGGTLRMLAEVFPDSSTINKVYWTVSDSKIATIDQDGLLKAVSNGIVTVKAGSLELNSEVSGQMEITVTGQTGIESVVTEYLRIYPNPADDGCFAIENMYNLTTLEVFDLFGRQIMKEYVYNKTSINIQLEVPAGLYIVRLSDGERHLHAKVIIK
ncbi:MAG: endo-1,4-beta-xylanase [Bacteroidales bacterium]|nr:endo-1,4-beta-xylanase [Bacteroidales bacterium]